MRVVALGGAGDMGRVAARTAFDFDFVEELIIADLDGDAAEKLAADLGTPARAEQVDVTDSATLGQLLENADVVLNTVGPFYRFGAPILEAAIDSGCHYLDINDDWEPTLDMLAMSNRAEAAGVTAIIGMGASPGISNMLAVRAMRGLDTVNELLTCWSVAGTGSLADGGEGAGPSAAIEHWMHQCSGEIRIWDDGGFIDVRPVVAREVEVPGVGTGRGWSVGHPEAVTLPLTFPEIRHSANLMSGPSGVMDIVAQLRDAIDGGELTVEQAAEMVSGPMPEQLLAEADATAANEVELPPLFALASGERDGSPHRVAAAIVGAPDGGMGGATGVPLAVILGLFESGALHRHGVFAPEGVIDPDDFFEALAPYCHAPDDSTPFTSADQLVDVTLGPAS